MDPHLCVRRENDGHDGTPNSPQISLDATLSYAHHSDAVLFYP